MEKATKPTIRKSFTRKLKPSNQSFIAPPFYAYCIDSISNDFSLYCILLFFLPHIFLIFPVGCQKGVRPGCQQKNRSKALFFSKHSKGLRAALPFTDRTAGGEAPLPAPILGMGVYNFLYHFGKSPFQFTALKRISNPFLKKDPSSSGTKKIAPIQHTEITKQKTQAPHQLPILV